MNEKSAVLSQAALDALERNALVNASRHGGKAEVGAIVSGVLGEFPELRSRAGDVASVARSVVGKVNAMGETEQLELLTKKYPEHVQQKKKEGRVGLPPLPNAEKGKVAFRLPPEPSGFMTIGHAMAFTINHLYSEMYDGELWLRFEDTNPKKAAKRYYESFREGIAWLGIKVDHEKNVSEDNEMICDHGTRLIREGKAYTCSCDQPKVKKLRFEGTVCEHRGRGPDENMRVWEEMLGRKHGEGSWVVRLKGDMGNPDYSLRDPNIFRIIEHNHPVTGSKYAVWPTYDLANTIEDEVCGITHILRSSEFHTALQRLIRETLSLRRVEVIQFSRFNFKGTPVQKRLLRPLVENGLVSGWDDPRMPTVAGVRRRGIIPETIRQFTLQVGYTKSEHEYDWSLLFAVNRKLLDPVSRRVFFVPNPVGLRVEGAPRKKVTIKFHPEKDLGERTVDTSGEFFVPGDDAKSLKKGSVFRLMELFNVELLSTEGRLTAKYTGDELVQDTRKVQWVTPDHVEAKVLVPGALFNDAGEFDPESLTEVSGYGERAMASLKEGEIVQLPRFGFCRQDSPHTLILTHK
ncbi:MAG: glutamate--tRNA ligase [Nitrososphaerales archaeon]|nr:glutamate--tRNA ligase [Nitrososphaerales archaeon]